MPTIQTALSEWMDLINARICPEHILQGQPTFPLVISYLLFFLKTSFSLPPCVSLAPRISQPFLQHIPERPVHNYLTKVSVIKGLLPFMQKSWLYRTLSNLVMSENPHCRHHLGDAESQTTPDLKNRNLYFHKLQTNTPQTLMCLCFSWGSF